MMQKAVIWQSGNSTASERIEYDRASEVVKAGQVGSSSKRVHVILQPKCLPLTLANNSMDKGSW
jgi:lipopolysaccharide export system protein LptA